MLATAVGHGGPEELLDGLVVGGHECQVDTGSLGSHGLGTLPDREVVAALGPE
jgi:hypothetical protein